MQSAIRFVAFVAWSLWFGATIAVFVFGWNFQKLLPPATFHESARVLLQVFARYELVLAAVALLASGMLLVIYPSRGSVILVGCMVLAGGMAVTVALGLMPMMESLRNEGRTDSVEWRKLHGKSMAATAMQAVVLLGTGWVILRSDRSGNKHPGATWESRTLTAEAPDVHPGL